LTSNKQAFGEDQLVRKWYKQSIDRSEVTTSSIEEEGEVCEHPKLINRSSSRTLHSIKEIPQAS